MPNPEWNARFPIRWKSISGTGQAPSFVSASTLVAGVLGSAARSDIVAVGSAPLRYAVTGGSVPPGRALDANTGRMGGMNLFLQSGDPAASAWAKSGVSVVSASTAAPAPAPAPAPPPPPAPVPAPAPAPAPAPSTGPVGQDGALWVRTFTDEFDSGSVPSSDRWNIGMWYGEHISAGNMGLPDGTVNYDVNGGRLRIWPELNGSGLFFNRAITTRGKFQQRYGYFEARVKMNRGKGCWPAFWLFRDLDGQAPSRPEIDIFECYAGGGAASWWGTDDWRPTTWAPTFWTDNGGAETTDDVRSRSGPFMSNEGINLDADFHVYGLRWQSGGRMDWYFDGQPRGSTTFSAGDKLDTNELYIIFDLWYGSASGDPSLTNDVTGTPRGSSNSLEIDYVRAWRAA
jgi:hypothetical protein